MEIKDKILFDNFVMQDPMAEQQFSNTQVLNKSSDFCRIRESLRSARANSNSNDKVDKATNRLRNVNKKNPYFMMNSAIQNLNST